MQASLTIRFRYGRCIFKLKACLLWTTMKRFDVKRMGRLISEIAVLLAIYFVGCQIAGR